MSSKWLLITLLAGIASAQDDIDYEVGEKMMMKVIRQAVNQTKADTLNLPSNATSIRENITDTFSCDNLTYGYYADVDNDCQVFHVCLPSQSPSGRNTTYRWSFICPKETVFNQEVLVCTRPRDAIDCEDSPMYYDKNMDIGKVNTTDEQTNSETNNYAPNNNKEDTYFNDDKPRLPNKRKIKKPNQKRKQNIVIEHAVNNINDALNNNNDNEERQDIKNYDKLELTDMMNDDLEVERIASERSMTHKIRKGGLFRFKADVV